MYIFTVYVAQCSVALQQPAKAVLSAWLHVRACVHACVYALLLS